MNYTKVKVLVSRNRLGNVGDTVLVPDNKLEMYLNLNLVELAEGGDNATEQRPNT